ncbi:HNH endonuclease [Bacillus sp. FJAT-45037]|uniref:HNH endonuclease n=1 Tax=Bacillus sp. FJAT-45037 TaxID=2011007 RepID=UPI000C24979C|nr:HNH endonuclease signature motif containing protein [Bacillus sp. FJAT-45037]
MLAKKCNREHASSWNKNNPEKRNEKSRRWYKDNSAKKSAYAHNNRAEKLGLKATLTAQMVEQLSWSRQGKCWLSGRSDVTLEIDHAVPLSRGGGSHLGNLILIDKKLNMMNKTQTLIEFLNREDIQALIEPAHVEETLRQLANSNSMSVPAYELYAQALAEKHDKKKNSPQYTFEEGVLIDEGNLRGLDYYGDTGERTEYWLNRLQQLQCMEVH